MSDIETLLLAYADGELDPEEARNVERLLERDPRAQQQLKIYRETTALLRAACAEPFYRDVPEKLIETVQRARPRTLAPRRAAYAVAASVLLASLGFAAGYGIGTRPPSEYDALMDEISEYHGVYARDSSHLVEVPASRTGEIEAWLGEHIGGHLTVAGRSRSSSTPGPGPCRSAFA
jgi:anti-sigma factor RsiW